MAPSSDAIIGIPRGFRTFPTWPDEYDIGEPRGSEYGAVTVLLLAGGLALVVLYKRYCSE